MKKLLQTTGLIFAMLLLANVGMAQTPVFSPGNGATGVSTSPTLTIEFEDNVTPVKKGFIYVFRHIGEGLEQVYSFHTGTSFSSTPDSHLSFYEKTLTIDLSTEVLTEETQFSIFADEGAIKVGGDEWNELSDIENPKWSFTTKATASSEGPIIVSVAPAKGTTDVSVKPTLTVLFDRDITKGSGGFFKLISAEGVVSYGPSNSKVIFSGKQFTVNAEGLDYSANYRVVIEPGFIENYSGLSDHNYWTFTTETKPPQWADNYPTITQSPTGFSFKGKSDLAGTYYFVVTGSLTPPSKEQIKAGKNSSGGNAYMSFNGDMIGNNEFSTNMDFASELLRGNSYYLHALVASDDGKNGEVETRSIDRTSPTINDVLSYPIDGYELFPVDDSILIVFSEKVNNYNGGIDELSSDSFDLKTDGQSVSFSFSISEDGTEVTLTPQEPLLGNTKYEVEIAPLSDDYYNVMSSSVTRTFYTDQLNVWTGDSSDSWTEAENWEEAYVPEKSVLIQSGSNNYPLIEDDITVNNLTIEAGAVVTQTDGTITVLGDFDLLSSEATNASYLPKGGTLTIEGDTRVHQHIVPELGTSVVYVMGTPTFGATNSNVGTRYIIKKYDNPTDSWLRINADLMEPGIGYSVYAENDLIFRGDINRAATEHNLVRTNGKGYGWNVMGNPFTTGMKWGELSIDTVTVENSYWIWNPHNKVYGAFNQEAGVGVGNLNGTIPSNHGFLVKLKIGETTGSITFDPKAMVANDNNHLKSASKINPHIKLSAGDGNYSDQLAIAFVPDAAQGIDKFDTEKFLGSAALEIFSVEGSSKLSINSLPETNRETSVGLGYKANKAGTYTIHLNENHLEHSEVILTDTKEGISVDLLYEGSYAFNVNKKETNNTRFTLTFPANIPTSVEKNQAAGNTNIYLKDGDVIVDVRVEAETLTYDMVSVSGNRVARGDLYSGVNNLGKFTSGLYIINTRNEEGTIISKKLLVTH